MKTKLTILSVFFTLVGAYAQIQFEQVLPSSVPQIIADIPSISYSSIAFADIDGDNDQDVLITGFDNSRNLITKLYTNDGLGNFTEVTGTSFTGVSSGSIAFADIDGDNDQDVLITGFDNSRNSITKLYTNDGLGNFTEVTGTSFTGVGNGSIAFADIDGDNDQDVLITGDADSGAITKLYTNDGSGNFAEVTSTSFIGVANSSIAFADVDGDNDQDVLITGDADSGAITKLHTNDGLGNFTEVTGTPFTGVEKSSIAFADIDGDNDQDVLITGNADSGAITKLYTNDGLGNFTEVTGTPFIGVYLSSVIFADVDDDNDQDILITGAYDDINSASGLYTISKLYTNDGLGNFTEVTEFIGVGWSSVAFADIDGDNDQDLLITGYHDININSYDVSKFYINDGNGNFIEETKSFFTGVANGSIAFADIDGDNDQDVLISGVSSAGAITKLYTNDGLDNFTEDATSFIGITGSSIAFADIDGDNDKDVLITGLSSTSVGYSPYEGYIDLYYNDGLSVFTPDLRFYLPYVVSGSIAFADIDGDNDQDLLITGSGNAKLFTNDGSGYFTEVTGTPFTGVGGSSIAFADIDGDNDQDVMITGKDSSYNPITKLYANDGSGNFTEVTSTSFVGVSSGSIAFADVDGDNDQDIMITGLDNTRNQIAELYTNDGLGNFTEVTGTPFTGVSVSSIAFADIDGDNDQDVMITGQSDNGEIAKMYINNGIGIFTEVTSTSFTGVSFSSIAFADIDGDNDQDILITGQSSTGEIAFLYRNNTVQAAVDEVSVQIINVFPNPSKHSFFIDIQDNKSINDVSLFNLQGQHVPFIYDKEQYKIDVNLPKGVYIVSFTIDKVKKSQKIVVE